MKKKQGEKRMDGSNNDNLNNNNVSEIVKLQMEVNKLSSTINDKDKEILELKELLSDYQHAHEQLRDNPHETLKSFGIDLGDNPIIQKEAEELATQAQSQGVDSQAVEGFKQEFHEQGLSDKFPLINHLDAFDNVIFTYQQLRKEDPSIDLMEVMQELEDEAERDLLEGKSNAEKLLSLKYPQEEEEMEEVEIKPKNKTLKNDMGKPSSKRGNPSVGLMSILQQASK